MPRRFVVFIALLLLGGVLAFFLVPAEMATVSAHILNFPEADLSAHSWRPPLLGVICFLPAIFAVYYICSNPLDRYLLMHLIGAFLVCFGAFLMIWILLDVNDNIEEMAQADNTFLFLGKYYLVTFSPLFVLLAPYALLLALLYSLGALSKSREIIAMIQTGRGVARLIFPLGVFGVFVTVACLLFNYHWGPWAEGYRRAMIDEIKYGTSTQASQVTYFAEEGERFWYVERFPYDYAEGAALSGVRVISKAQNEPVSILRAKEAVWDLKSGQWEFRGVVETDLTQIPLPVHTQYEAGYFKDWAETPWQIVKPGLSPLNMGVPDLHSWLSENKERHWVDRAPYLTQWHYRWAQPWICLVIVLMAAPLGIVFSRRGTAGGLAVAVFLCAGMMFISTVFLAFGESGNMAPILAAWATNFLFLGVALVLLYRRASGQPIYQTLKQLLPTKG